MALCEAITGGSWDLKGNAGAGGVGSVRERWSSGQRGEEVVCGLRGLLLSGGALSRSRALCYPDRCSGSRRRATGEGVGSVFCGEWRGVAASGSRAVALPSPRDGRCDRADGSARSEFGPGDRGGASRDGAAGSRGSPGRCETVEGIRKLQLASSLQPNFLEKVAEYFAQEPDT